MRLFPGSARASSTRRWRGPSLSLGSALGVQTVAEGIEQAEQVHELRELGCERGQGFYFSRPQDEAAITALLAQEQRGGEWIANRFPEKPAAA